VPKVKASVTVPATPEVAWATASDLSRFDEWMSIHDGWRGAAPKEVTAGMTLTSVVKVMGFRNRIRWHVDSYSPPTALSITGHGLGGVKVALTMSVRPSRAGTEVRVDAEVTGKPLFGPIGIAVGRAVRADVRRSVAALAALIHSSDTGFEGTLET
jgi:carbon monoxide dehydrogenase subunit G